ncbi:hypothetical protein D3C81_1856390 [compost metagenome]
MPFLQVQKIPLGIKRYFAVSWQGQSGQQLQLIRLPAEQQCRVVPAHRAAFDGTVLPDDLLHLLLNGRQILRSEGFLHIKIIIKAILSD